MFDYIVLGALTGVLITAGHVAIFYVLCNGKGGRNGS